jgi:structural maintenance of chromosome 4
VIDALLFVFGRRSKQIRSAKVAELIHRSEAFPDLDSATVTVTFQEIIDHEHEADAFDVVPHSTIEVARTARKNGSSTYYVNGKVVQFKDVADLLLTKGIDLDNNRFLILQGEVEQISLMKPKGAADGEEGLLEYLEDIIGTSKYVEPIQEKFNAVEAATEERAAQLHRVQIVEKDLKQLEGAKDEAVDFLQRTGELKVAQAALYSLQAAECAAQQRELAAEQDRCGGNQAKYEAQMAELVAQKAAHEATYADQEAAFEASSKAVERCKAEYEEHVKRDIGLTEKLKYNATSRKKMAASVAKDQRVVADCERDETQLTQDIADRDAEAGKLEKQLGKEEAKLEEIVKSETEQLHGLLQEKQAELHALAPPLDAAREAQQLCAQEHKLLADQLHGARDKADAARRALDALREQAAQLDGEIGEKQTELDDCRARRPRATGELADARKALERNAAAVAEARATLAERRRASARSTPRARCGPAQQGEAAGPAARHSRPPRRSGDDRRRVQRRHLDRVPSAQQHRRRHDRHGAEGHSSAAQVRPRLGDVHRARQDAAARRHRAQAVRRAGGRAAPLRPAARRRAAARRRVLLCAARHAGGARPHHGAPDRVWRRAPLARRHRRRRAHRPLGHDVGRRLARRQGPHQGEQERRRRRRRRLGRRRADRGAPGADRAHGDARREPRCSARAAVPRARAGAGAPRAGDSAPRDRAAQAAAVEAEAAGADRRGGARVRDFGRAVKKVDKKDEAKLAALTTRLAEHDAALENATAAFGAVEADVTRMEKEILSSTSVRCTVQRSKVEELTAQLDANKKALIKARVELKGSAQKHEKAKARLDKLKASWPRPTPSRRSSPRSTRSSRRRRARSSCVTASCSRSSRRSTRRWSRSGARTPPSTTACRSSRR